MSFCLPGSQYPAKSPTGPWEQEFKLFFFSLSLSLSLSFQLFFTQTLPVRAPGLGSQTRSFSGDEEGRKFLCRPRRGSTGGGGDSATGREEGPKA